MPKKKTTLKLIEEVEEMILATPSTEKRWNSYEDYLKSPEWKQIKKEFRENNPDLDNICEISGHELSDDCRSYLHLHHFRYPKDWNNDSWENLIQVSDTVHSLIHRPCGECEFNNKNKTIYKAEVRQAYNIYMYTMGCFHTEKNKEVK